MSSQGSLGATAVHDEKETAGARYPRVFDEGSRVSRQNQRREEQRRDEKRDERQRKRERASESKREKKQEVD